MDDLFVISDFVELKIRQLAKENGLSEEEVLSTLHLQEKFLWRSGRIAGYSELCSGKWIAISIRIQDMNSFAPRMNPWPKNTVVCKKHRWMGTHHFWGSPYTMEAFFDEILTAKRVTNSAGLRHFLENSHLSWSSRDTVRGYACSARKHRTLWHTRSDPF